MACLCHNKGCKRRIAGEIHPQEMEFVLKEYQEKLQVLEKYASNIPNVEFATRMDAMAIRLNYFASLDRKGAIDHDSLPVCEASSTNVHLESKSVQTENRAGQLTKSRSSQTVPVESLEER